MNTFSTTSRLSSLFTTSTTTPSQLSPLLQPPGTTKGTTRTGQQWNTQGCTTGGTPKKRAQDMSMTTSLGPYSHSPVTETHGSMRQNRFLSSNCNEILQILFYLLR